MKGILLISHGMMAEGMADSAKMFMGEEIDQFDYVCYHMGDNPDTFEQEIGHKLKMLDTGEGVLVLADLFGGTPTHKTSSFLNEQVQVITGMNFPMLLELLSQRTQQTIGTIEKIMTIGKSGIQEWNPMIPQEEDDLFE